MDIVLIVYNILLFIPIEICISSVETNVSHLKEQQNLLFKKSYLFPFFGWLFSSYKLQILLLGSARHLG